MFDCRYGQFPPRFHMAAPPHLNMAPPQTKAQFFGYRHGNLFCF
jgi:hypothetical protein